MVAVDILQKIQAEAEKLLGQLNSSSSRFYEISSAGSIVERTQELRDFYAFIGSQLEHVVTLLRGPETQ